MRFSRDFFYRGFSLRDRSRWSRDEYLCRGYVPALAKYSRRLLWKLVEGIRINDIAKRVAKHPAILCVAGKDLPLNLQDPLLTEQMEKHGSPARDRPRLRKHVGQCFVGCVLDVRRGVGKGSLRSRSSASVLVLQASLSVLHLLTKGRWRITLCHH